MERDEHDVRKFILDMLGVANRSLLLGVIGDLVDLLEQLDDVNDVGKFYLTVRTAVLNSNRFAVEQIESCFKPWQLVKITKRKDFGKAKQIAMAKMTAIGIESQEFIAYLVANSPLVGHDYRLSFDDVLQSLNDIDDVFDYFYGSYRNTDAMALIVEQVEQIYA